MITQADLERRRPGPDRLARALHVTNGDVTVDLLRRAGLAGQALAWAGPGRP
jgi:hypothetical protein